MKFELKRIGVWSVVKIGFLIWGLLGFIAGIYIALMMPLILSMLGSLGGFPGDEDALTPVTLVFLPFMYSLMSAVIGTALTVVVVVFYNIMSRLTGGVEIDLDAEKIYPIDVFAQSSAPGWNDETKSP